MTKANLKALGMATALVAFVYVLHWVAGAP